MVLIRLLAIHFPGLSTSEAWALQFTVGTSEDGAVYYNSKQTQAINSALNPAASRSLSEAQSWFFTQLSLSLSSSENTWWP